MPEQKSYGLERGVCYFPDIREPRQAAFTEYMPAVDYHPRPTQPLTTTSPVRS